MQGWLWFISRHRREGAASRSQTGKSTHFRMTGNSVGVSKCNSAGLPLGETPWRFAEITGELRGLELTINSAAASLDELRSLEPMINSAAPGFDELRGPHCTVLLLNNKPMRRLTSHPKTTPETSEICLKTFYNTKTTIESPERSKKGRENHNYLTQKLAQFIVKWDLGIWLGLQTGIFLGVFGSNGLDLTVHLEHFGRTALIWYLERLQLDNKSRYSFEPCLSCIL